MDPFFANEEKIVRVLYKNVTNMGDFRKLVFNARLPVCLIKPKLIVDDFMLSVAITKALYNKKDHTMTTKSLTSEIMYCLSPYKNITESLKTFGSEEDDTAVIIIGTEAIYQSVKESIHGEEADLVNDISKFTDVDTVMKIYEITKEELTKSSLLDSVISRMSTKDYSL